MQRLLPSFQLWLSLMMWSVFASLGAFFWAVFKQVLLIMPKLCTVVFWQSHVAVKNMKLISLKTSVTNERLVPHPVHFPSFTSLEEMLVIIQQIPFKNKQAFMDTGLLLLGRGAIYPLDSVLMSSPFVVHNWNHSIDCVIKWQLPCLGSMKHSVVLK